MRFFRNEFLAQAKKYKGEASFKIKLDFERILPREKYREVTLFGGAYF